MSFLLDKKWKGLLILWFSVLAIMGFALSKAGIKQAAYEQLESEWKGMVRFPWALNKESEMALTAALKRLEAEQAAYDNDSRVWGADVLDQAGFTFQCQQAMRLQHKKAKEAGIILKPVIDKDYQAFLKQIKMANKSSLKALNQEWLVYEAAIDRLLRAKPVSIESIKRGKGALTIEFVGNTEVLKTWMAALAEASGRFWVESVSFQPYAEECTEAVLQVGPRWSLVKARLQWGEAL